ncbi:MAG: hypothetical protein IGS39_07885 [Calothrix sp. C42_A2020_038]|nr:hypothetical protein [Calothrix sp. C42_A2020_038]
MSADLTSIPSSDFIADLERAATAFEDKTKTRPQADVIVNALLQAEKTAKQQRLTYSFASLSGTWRLCFATGTRSQKRGGIVLGKGFYMPKFTPAYISFSTSEASDNTGEITNQIQLGVLRLKLSGLTQYIGKKNLLAFDFHQMQISLFGRTIYNASVPGAKTQPDNFYNYSVAKLPFFAFFVITEDLIAARGRGGGLALWIKTDTQC